MRTLDRLVVPLSFVAALVAVLAVTVSWIGHPVQPIGLTVSMGPPGIAPGKVVGLSFTPRNPLSGHILTRMIPSQAHCVDVTITDQSLTYLDQARACRLPGGSYKLAYAFPRPDNYVIFVEMQPQGGLAHVVRKTLDLCAPAAVAEPHTPCATPTAALRGREVVRSHAAGALQVVLGAPPHAAYTGQDVAVTFLILRDGRAVAGLDPIHGAPGRAVAISRDTRYLVPLTPEAGQVADGNVAGGVVAFTGRFAQPSIYKVFGTFSYHHRPLRTSFVVDVNPQPTPTPDT